MLKKLRFVLLCLLLAQFVPVVHARQTVPTAPRPAWVAPVALPADSKIAEGDVSNGYAYALRDYQFHLPSQTRYCHLVRRIFTAEGVQQGSEIEVSYDPTYQKLLFHDIKILRDGKAIDKLEPAKFKIIQRESSKESYIYDGSLLALLILEDVRAGDQIEYAFSVVGDNPIYGGRFAHSIYLGTGEPIDVVSLRIISPGELQTKTLNLSLPPTVTRENGQVVYQWYRERVPGASYDDDTPAWYNPYPILQVSGYRSWEEVSGWALQHYTYPAKPGKGLTEFIDQIKGETDKPAERLEKALQFVQDEIRYTGLEAGIGGYKPRNPADVFEQRFGDCKDKSLLLCYVLRELGIEAYPALVSTTDRKGIIDWLPSPNAFNHCVVQVRQGGVYWYDPTISLQGGSYHNRYFGNLGYALVIRPGTKALTKIESARASKTQVKEVFTMKDIGGPVHLAVTTQYYGFEADQIRQQFAAANLKETEKSYLNYTAKTFPQVAVKAPLRTEDNRAGNVFTTYESYEVTNFWIAPDTTQPRQLEGSVYPQTLRDKLFVPSTKIRTAPFALEYPMHYEHTIRLDLPEPWTVETQEQEIVGPGIQFNLETKYVEQSAIFRYTYQTTQDHVGAKATAEFVKKQNQVINALGYSLTYNQSTGGASSVRVNWLMVLLGLLCAAGTAWGALRVYAYDPEPVIIDEPGREIGGWLSLLALGLFIRPLLHLMQILNGNYFDWHRWETITTQTSGEYNPTLASVLVAELFYNITMMGFCVVLIFLFVRRRSSLPNLVTVLYGISIVFVALETYLLWDMKLLANEEAASQARDLLWLVVSAVIWVPYLHLSQRAKETFVETLRVPEDRQEIYRPNF